MSLARTLMMNSVNGNSIDTTGYDYSNVATMESYFVDAACESLFADIIKVDHAYHIADIMGEVKVVREGADGYALLEGMIKDAAKKLQDAFKKFWAKLKAWFAQVKKFFKSLFLNNKDFVKEFRKELLTKKTTGFKYHSYAYQLEEGNGKVDHIINAVWGELDNIETTLSTLCKEKNKARIEDLVKQFAENSRDSVDTSISSTDYQDKFVKDKCGVQGATTLSELTEELGLIYRDGDSNPRDISEFEEKNNKVEDMIRLLEDDKLIRNIEKEESDFEKQINTLIKALDGYKNTTDNDAIKWATKVSSYATALLTVGKSSLSEKMNANKEALKEYRSILGAFARFKPAKEGAEMDDDEDVEEGCKKSGCNESLLEAAMYLL